MKARLVTRQIRNTGAYTCIDGFQMRVDGTDWNVLYNDIYAFFEDDMKYVFAREVLDITEEVKTGKDAEAEAIATAKKKNKAASDALSKALAMQCKLKGSRDYSTFTDVLEDIAFYKPNDLDKDTAIKVAGKIDKILTVVINIGMVAALLILAILGIKYMLGSVEEKAEYKKDLIPYMIGVGLIFGIVSFVKIFMVWGQSISNL